MKHKYVFTKDTAADEISIREYAELSKDVFTLICESNYEVLRFEKALSQGSKALIAEMRTQNFYPPASFAEKIVPGFSDIISSGEQEMVEIFCDDAEFLAKSLDDLENFEDVENSEDETLDEFIEDLPDTLSDGNVTTGKVAASDSDDADDHLEGEA